jgi:hypothetical protein
MLAVFLLTSLSPDPIFSQYFTAPLVPFFLPAVGLAVQKLCRRRSVVVAGGVVVVVLGLFVLFGQRAEQSRDPWWSLDAIEQVTSAIERHSEAEDFVLSFWPGFVFESGRQYLPGLENQFGIGLTNQLTPRQCRRYHIADYQQILTAFRLRRPKVVVIGAWMNELNQVISNEQVVELLDATLQNYVLREDYGEVGVMTRRTGTDP